jgi:hypothetical protein
MQHYEDLNEENTSLKANYGSFDRFQDPQAWLEEKVSLFGFP